MKNPKQYEKLRSKGMSKQQAAAITNSVSKADQKKQGYVAPSLLGAGSGAVAAYSGPLHRRAVEAEGTSRKYADTVTNAMHFNEKQKRHGSKVQVVDENGGSLPSQLKTAHGYIRRARKARNVSRVGLAAGTVGLAGAGSMALHRYKNNVRSEFAGVNKGAKVHSEELAKAFWTRRTDEQKEQLHGLRSNLWNAKRRRAGARNSAAFNAEQTFRERNPHLSLAADMSSAVLPYTNTSTALNAGIKGARARGVQSHRQSDYGQRLERDVKRHRANYRQGKKELRKSDDVIESPLLESEFEKALDPAVMGGLKKIGTGFRMAASGTKSAVTGGGVSNRMGAGVKTIGRGVKNSAVGLKSSVPALHNDQGLTTAGHVALGATAAGAGTGIGLGLRKHFGKSAFDRSEIAKDEQSRNRSGGGAALGTGATLGAAGFAGGGVPGVKAKRIMADVKSASGRGKKTAEFARAYRGGEFGYRTNAHHTFKTFGMHPDPKEDTRAAHFNAAHDLGKIESEKKIITHLKVGRAASHAALAGGLGLTAFGAHRMHQNKVEKADDSRGRKSAQTAGGAALGVGGTVALGSHGVARTLEHEGRKWSSRAEDELAGAQRIAPKLGGSITSTDPRYAKNPRVPDVRPATANAKTKNMSEHYMKGKTKMEAEMAGKLRGQAGQSRYFAGTYGSMAGLVRRARKPAVGLAAAGAGGIALSHAHRRNIGKSAFDRELTTA